MQLKYIFDLILGADWVSAVIAGSTHGLFVFFKAFQQRNVVLLHYRWVPPISFCMSTSEVFVLSLVAVGAVDAASSGNWWQMLPYCVCLGTGGSVGSLIAMAIHVKFISHDKKGKK